MIEYAGNTKIREQLEASLPVVSLFRGPESVGKMTLAHHLTQVHGYKPADVFQAPELSADKARLLKRFMMTAPFGHGKLAILRLSWIREGKDGQGTRARASEASLNALLKLLEEPPRTAKFILTTSERPLDTIASRSSVYSFGLLADDEVAQVLVRRFGMDSDKALRLAQLGRGQMKRSMEAEEVETAKAPVLSVLKAISDKDLQLLENVLSRASSSEDRLRWDERSHDLLRTWCVEAITGRWRVFTDSETFGLAKDKNMPRRILFSLNSSARPQLALRVGLAGLLADKPASV